MSNIFFDCTCGAASVKSPRHSNWCDINSVPDFSIETSWEAFKRMSTEGWTGTYVYVTKDSDKLGLVLTGQSSGNWLVLTPSEMVSRSTLHPGSATKIWLEKSASDNYVLQMATYYASRAGTVSLVDG